MVADHIDALRCDTQEREVSGRLRLPAAAEEQMVFVIFPEQVVHGGVTLFEEERLRLQDQWIATLRDKAYVKIY